MNMLTSRHRESEPLAAYDILDTLPEAIYDNFVGIVARVLAAPIAGVGFVSGNRLWLKSSIGLACHELPVDPNDSGATIATRSPCLIRDALSGPDGRNHPLVMGVPGIRFCASVPLVTPDGTSIGVFFVADQSPRPEATGDVLRNLADLALLITAGLDLRIRRIASRDTLAELELINHLLAAATSAPNVDGALRDVMTVLNDSVGACSCFVWHVPNGPDALRQVAAVANRRLTERDFLGAVPQMNLGRENTTSGSAVRRGKQIITRSVATIYPQQGALIDLWQNYGVVSQITTPMRIGDEAYSIAINFDRLDVDLDAVAALVLKATRAIIPALAQTIESERTALFHRIVEASSDSVIVTDADEAGPRIVYVNPAFERMTGHRASDLLGRSPQVLQGPETDPAAEARLRQAVAARQPAHERLVNYRADGSPYTVELSVAPVIDAGGQTRNFVAIQRDITEQLRVEERRQQETRVLADAMRLAHLGTWRVNLRAGTLEWSDEIYASFAIDRALGDITRARAASLVHPEDRARTRAWLKSVITATGDQRLEYRCIRPDGRTLYCWVEGRRTADPISGDAIIEGVCQDITERRETEIALLHAEKLRTIGQMTGGVAHDFNNLLTVISVSLDLAETAAEGNADLLSLIRAARGAADKGAHLTSQLLAYARRQRLMPRVIAPDSFVAELAAIVPHTLGPNHQLVTELDIGSAPFVADPAQLEAAILNICINARDAQPRGGELRLRIAPVTIIEGADETWPPPGRYTTITVTDHGTGMDPATRAHAFEPFFTTKPVGKGTGLGLSMVKGFARQSGGHIAIDTAPGRGTSVTLYMPVAAGAIASTAPQPSPTPAILPPIEVLLVEDQDDVRSATSRLCADCGLQPTPAASAEEALAYLQGGVKFGLMFASVERGCGMNGADLAAAAQKLQPDLPVLLTSGSGDHAPTGLHLLEKPYARDALIAAVQRAIAAPPRI